MRGYYTPFGDGFGIIGWHYVCPECRHTTRFTDCEEGCEECGFSESYEDPDDWYDAEMLKPKEERAWNLASGKKTTI